MRKCLARSLFFENCLPHTVHLWDFLQRSVMHWYLTEHSGWGSVFSSLCETLATISVDTSLLHRVGVPFSDTTMAASRVNSSLLHRGATVILSAIASVWLFEKCIASTGHGNDVCSIASPYVLKSQMFPGSLVHVRRRGMPQVAVE